MTLVDELLDGTGIDWWDDGSLAAWLSGAASMLQPITDLVRDSDDGPGYSALYDVARCPSYALGWLGQHVGVRLDANDTDANQRATISAETNFGRGTVDRLKAVATPLLTGSQTVLVTERDTSPYHLTVTVYNGELNALHYNQLAASWPTYADLDAALATYEAFTFSITALTNALLAAKPAGLQLSLVIASGWPNMLTADDASFEGSIGTWVSLANATLARDTTLHEDGAACLRVTASAAGSVFIGTALNGYPVTPGLTYTALMSFLAATTARSCRARILWYDAAGVEIGVPVVGTDVTDTTTGWTQATTTGVAPAGAVYAQVSGVIIGAASGGVHYVDETSLAPGTSTIWTPGH